MSASQRFAMVAMSLGVVLLGVSYMAWGNWIPLAQTINNPGAYGVFMVGLGGVGIIASLLWRDGQRDRW